MNAMIASYIAGFISFPIVITAIVGPVAYKRIRKDLRW